MPSRPPRRGAFPHRYRRPLGRHLLFFFGPSSSVPASSTLPSLLLQLAASLSHPPLFSGFPHVAVSRFVPSCHRSSAPLRPPMHTPPPSRPPLHHHPRLLHLLFRPSPPFRLPLGRGGRRHSTFFHRLPRLLLRRLLVSLPSRRLLRPVLPSSPGSRQALRDPSPLWSCLSTSRLPRPSFSNSMVPPWSPPLPPFPFTILTPTPSRFSRPPCFLLVALRVRHVASGVVASATRARLPPTSHLPPRCLIVVARDPSTPTLAPARSQSPSTRCRISLPRAAPDAKPPASVLFRCLVPTSKPSVGVAPRTLSSPSFHTDLPPSSPRTPNTSSPLALSPRRSRGWWTPFPPMESRR